MIGRQPLILDEGHTQRGNRSGGPAMPKPEISPKPQPTGSRLIGPDGVPIGYLPKPEFPQPRVIREGFLP